MIRKLISVVLLCGAVARAGWSQQPHRAFGEIGAGMLVEEVNIGVNSRWGRGGTLGIGRQIGDRLAVTARLGAGSFPKGVLLICPGPSPSAAQRDEMFAPVGICDGRP